jgi:hypothetical protein
MYRKASMEVRRVLVFDLSVQTLTHRHAVFLCWVLGADFIPVYGQLVADLIRKRLTQPEEEVEA